MSNRFTRAVSWDNYGTHDNSKYPELWADCVRAICPSLGPTGNKLVDLALPGAERGTIDGTSTSTWVVNEGKWAYDVYDNLARTNFTYGVLLGASHITISCWYRPDAFMVYGVLYKESVTGSASNRIFLATREDGTFGIGGFAPDVGSFQFWKSNQILSAGKWYHVCGTLSVIGDLGAIYINGIPQTLGSTGDFSNQALDASASSVVSMGASNFASPSDFPDGLIDDLRVYRRVLQPEEIMLLAQERGIAYTPIKRTTYFFTGDLTVGSSSRYLSIGGKLIGTGGKIIGVSY